MAASVRSSQFPPKNELSGCRTGTALLAQLGAPTRPRGHLTEIKLRNAITWLTLLCAGASAWAGRPLATDDAATADLGRCQFESWVERDRENRALVLAPAFGVAKGVELGADYTRPSPRDTVRGAGGLALKWVPESWRLGTALGEMNFGLKLATAYQQPAGVGWRHAEASVLALASLKASDAWAMHANLGLARDRAARESATLLNLAAVWTPAERALLFAEAQANNKRATFGGTVSRAGARWWLHPERFGIDLTAGRQSGSGTGTSWGLGFGWYGLAF